MARAGMTRWRSRNCAPVADGCDEVQKSLDLLDRVLSEFDDCESGAAGEPTPEKSLLSSSSSVQDSVVEQITSLKSCGTPEDESPSSFGGHQSEDDGYMSMNGRKARLLMTSSSTSSSNDFSNGDENGVTTPKTPPPVTSKPIFHSGMRLNGDFPPPPEEAERIISTLLPRVSPCSSSQRNHKSGRKFLNNVALSLEEDAGVDKFGRSVTTATQTTLPKTKHQRPYGWQKEVRHQQRHSPSTSNGVPRTCSKYGSLPYDGVSYPENFLPPWLQRSVNQVPPRTVPTVLDRHREVRRCVDEEDPAAVQLNPVEETVDEDPANFSDDSLEDVPPPPPPAPQQPANKRSSIAWEVSLDSDNEALMIPGSTKVVGRRRRKSTDHSSNGSLTTLSIYDDWPEPPNGTDDSLSCLISDSELDGISANLRAFNEAAKKTNVQCGTYVIRRGSKKDRIQLSEMKTPTDSRKPRSPLYCNGDTDLKRCSSTFDNIKSLLKEGLVEGLDDSPPDFHPPKPPALSRGLSLPSILNDSIFGSVDDNRGSKRSSFVADSSRPSDGSQSSLELLGVAKTSAASKSSPTTVDCGRSTPHNYVSKCIWTGSDRDDDDKVQSAVEKQSVAVQVSADFTLLNKEIAEQSAGCQTDNEELNYCVYKAVNTAENITSTSTFQRRQSKKDNLDSREQPSEAPQDAAESRVTPGHDIGEDVPDGCGRLKEQHTDSSIEDLLVYNAKCEKEDEEVEEPVQRRHQQPEQRQLKPPQTMHKVEEQYLADMWNATRPLPNVRKAMPALKTHGHRNVCNGRLQEPPGDFRVNVEILNHEFGPLPPSPVEEVEDEYSDILQSVPTNRKSDSLNIESVYRRNSRISASGSIRSNRAPDVPPHRDYSNSSLKTRSVDAGFTRNHRTQFIGSRKDVPVERRTLPTDLPGTSHRRPYQKRGSQSPKDENAQVSCSLPETPIFARGCDIPRTPLRNTTDKSNSSRTTPRLNGIQTSSYARNIGAGHGTSLGEVMAGAELLRLTGPGRGWYPRHRQPRPASVEHLDRLTPQGLSPSAPTVGAWEARDSRKPLTLPPNLSPKFFQRSPREALRRVTSLLIRKGGNTKDTKSKDVLASSVIGPHGDFGETSRQQKRGFFRSFWKRSRHYSLDQQ